MLYKEYIKISSLSVHRVGNKAAVEGVELSVRPVEIDDALAGRGILPSFCMSRASIRTSRAVTSMSST